MEAGSATPVVLAVERAALELGVHALVALAAETVCASVVQLARKNIRSRGMGLKNIALALDAVAINGHCVGVRWSELDRNHLAHLIALVAMGQSVKAAIVITSLEEAQPAFALDQLCDEAIITLSVQEPDESSGERTGYPRYQRDGFIFEAISWVAAQQVGGEDAVLKPPHTSSTTQGLDGLMIEVDRDAGSIRSTTLFEDKCTDDPRATFLAKVLPTLKDRHSNKRSAELVSTASTLLAMAGFSAEMASRESARILDVAIRRYRSAFAVTKDFDTQERRSFLFGRYEELAGIQPDQRIGACFVVPGEMRDWFDEIATVSIAFIQSLKD